MSQSGSINGLAHIGIYTADMEESIQFYQEMLGFSVRSTEEIAKPQGVTQLAFLELGNCTIELIQPADVEGIMTRGAGKIDHIALAVTGIEDLVARLQSKGLEFETSEIIEAKVGKGIKIIFFSGPSGERLELFEAL